jgi:hypothetical protein
MRQPSRDGEAWAAEAAQRHRAGQDVARYALGGINRPVGVARYTSTPLVEQVPEELHDHLPELEQISAGVQRIVARHAEEVANAETTAPSRGLTPEFDGAPMNEDCRDRTRTHDLTNAAVNTQIPSVLARSVVRSQQLFGREPREASWGRKVSAGLVA